MAAAATDYFQKVGSNTATTLSSPGYTIGNSSVNVASTTNWPTDTGVHFAIDETETVGGEEVRVDGTLNIFRGTVNGATQITNLTYVGGDANRNYSAGATTRVYIIVNDDRENRLVDGLLVEHNQDGTHDEALINSRTAATPATGDSILLSDADDSNTLKKSTLTNLGANGAWLDTGGMVAGAATGEKLGTPVAFLAVSTSDQSISSSVFTKVNFNNEADTGDNFDLSTDTFTAPYDGWYSFQWAVAEQGNNDITSAIYKNGSLYKRGSWQDTSGTARSSVGSISISLSATDTIELYAFVAGTSPSLRGTNGEYTYLSGHLIGRTD